MDAATAAVVTTGAIGLAGIVATFFAPTWSQRKLEQRREGRAFRTAQRLVSHEMATIEGQSESFITALESGMPRYAKAAANTSRLVATEWPAHKEALSASLPDDVWVALANAYRSVGLTLDMWDAAGENELLGEQDLDFLKGNVESLREARRRLWAAEPRAD